MPIPSSTNSNSISTIKKQFPDLENFWRRMAGSGLRVTTGHQVAHFIAEDIRS